MVLEGGEAKIEGIIAELNAEMLFRGFVKK